MASSIFIGWFGGVQYSTSGTTVTFPSIAVTGQFIGPAADNTAAPPFTFSGDLTTGMASPAAGQIAMRVAGTTVGTWAIPTGNSVTSNFFRVAGTLPSTTTALNVGMDVAITSAGTPGNSQRAMRLQLLAGNTGTAGTNVLFASNLAAGTGQDGWTNQSLPNTGIVSTVAGSTTGHNVALNAAASSSSTLNLGANLRAVQNTNSPALNVGGSAFAIGATNNVAFFAGLFSTAPTVAETAVMILDNGAEAAPIALFKDNGTTVVTIADGGVITAPQFVTSNGTISLNSAGSRFILSASGSPEGVYASLVGSLYLRTDGGAGTTLYVKESGSGNTGWVGK